MHGPKQRLGVGNLTDVGTWSYLGWPGAVQFWEETEDCSGKAFVPLDVDTTYCTGPPYDFNFGSLTLGRAKLTEPRIKSLKYMGCSSSS